MTSRRSNRIKINPQRHPKAPQQPHEKKCWLCHEDRNMGGMGEVRFRNGQVCINCALIVLDGLLEVWEAPKITQAERLRFERERGLEGPKRKQPAPNAPGWVYYIRMGEFIKIGYSKDVARRMRAYPPGSDLLAAHPGTLETEKDVQGMFSDDRAQGREWFNPSGALMEHIASVVDQFGDVSHMAYKYTKPKSEEDRVRDMFKPPRTNRNAPGATHVA